MNKESHRAAPPGRSGRGRFAGQWAALLAVTLLALSACEQAPQQQMVRADGIQQGFSYDDWQGRWLLINYWAEWCAPCRKEIPELNALNARADVQVLGVNFDGIEGAKLSEVVAKMDVGFPTVLADPGAQFGVARPTVLPVTLVVAPDGTLHETLRGPQTEASIEAAMVLSAAPEPDNASPPEA